MNAQRTSMPEMNREALDTKEILQEYISQTLLSGRLQVEADDDLLGEEIIDSMGVMQLIAFIEERFDCDVAQADITITNFRTIEAIEVYLSNQNLVAPSLQGEVD